MLHRTARTTRPQRSRARWRQQTWAVDGRSNGPRLNRAGAEAANARKGARKVGRRSKIQRLTAAEPKRKRRTANYASGTRPTAFSGHSPATRATEARTEATYGCAIPLHTSWHHSQLRRRTRAAARRRGAAGKLLLTVTAQESYAAVNPAGAQASRGNEDVT